MNYRPILAALHLGTDLLGKIPRREDSLPEILSKLLAMADSVQRVYGIVKPDDYVTSLVDRLNLSSTSSETMVQLFFHTDLKNAFAIDHFKVADHMNVVEATARDGERLYFREYTWGRPEISPDFWYTPGFRFDRVGPLFWEQYKAGVFLSIESTNNTGGRMPTFTELNPLERVPLSSAANQRLTKVIGAQARFFEKNIPRAYLFLGPPGTGKTTFALNMAEFFGGRILQIDSSALAFLGVRELDLLLKALGPQFLILDDVDRADMSTVSARVLFVLQRLKVQHKQMCTILTVNDHTKLDPAILRCGRVDVPIRFDEPALEERHEVVQKYLRFHGVQIPDPEMMERVLSETKHLTHSYLADLCLRFGCEDPGEVLASVKLLHELAQQAQSGGPGAPGNGAKQIAKGGFSDWAPYNHLKTAEPAG